MRPPARPMTPEEQAVERRRMKKSYRAAERAVPPNPVVADSWRFRALLEEARKLSDMSDWDWGLLTAGTHDELRSRYARVRDSAEYLLSRPYVYAEDSGE